MKCMLLTTLIAAATAACPNGCSANGVCGAKDKCSGHGTCEFIDELAGDFYDRRTGPGNVYATRAGTKIGASTTNTQSAATTSGETVVTQAVPTTTRTDDVEQYHGF